MSGAFRLSSRILLVSFGVISALGTDGARNLGARDRRSAACVVDEYVDASAGGCAASKPGLRGFGVADVDDFTRDRGLLEGNFDFPAAARVDLRTGGRKGFTDLPADPA